MKDPYSVLGIDRAADEAAIQAAYRKLAKRHHPDLNKGDPQAAEKFKEINAANDLLSDPATRPGQSPMRSPTVFNFFRPGYVPPNSELGKQGITAPEFDITDESTTVGWVNFAQTFVVSGVGETRPNYTAEIAVANDAAALVQRVARLLAPGSMSVATQALITQAVATLPAVTDANRLNRVYAAVLLVLAAPEYLVQV